MKRLHLVGLLAVAALVAACGSSGGGAPSYSGKTIKLGAILSLTGAGGVYGPSSSEGMKLAVKQINGSGGVNGATIDLAVEDDQSDKNISSQKAQTFIQQNQVLALLGPTLSNSALTVHPLAETLKTPILAVSTTGIHIVPDCKFPETTPCAYVFRDSLGEETAIPTNIKAYADEAHPKTGVLLVAQDDKFSKDGGTIVQANTDKNGIQLLKTIPFNKGDADLTPYVTQAVQLKPDVIFITSLGQIPAQIMTAARKQGWQGQFLGGNGFNTAAVSKQAAANGKGARSGSAWYLGNTFPSNADFVSAYKAEYSKDPDQFAAQAYDCMFIVANAIDRAGAADPAKITAALSKTDYTGVMGPFTFTDHRDPASTEGVVVLEMQGGAFGIAK